MLFTDPAPLDALLQRFGRVNRGRNAPSREVVVFDQPVEDRRPYEEALLRGALGILEREFGEEGAILEESAVSGWLDEIYSGELADRWTGEYRRTKREFEEVVLDSLYPFQSSADLEKLFYRAFDGVEVLPICLLEEYRERTEEQPLSASELLVPIRWAQLGRLYGEGAVVEALELDGVCVINRPYSEELGLEI
jgi:CRISPR-associated endonuclease/helicase Cas3